VRRLLPWLLGASLAFACSTGSPAPAATATPTPNASPAPPAVVVGPPVARILDGAQAGLAPAGGQDHLDLAAAASREENQPLALTRFRSWGWVDEATRAWGGASPHLDESLLLLTRVEGARMAFADLIVERLVAPFTSTPCPMRLGLDECAEARAGGRGLLIGQAGPYVITLSAAGVDLDSEAALQLQRLRS